MLSITITHSICCISFICINICLEFTIKWNWPIQSVTVYFQCVPILQRKLERKSIDSVERESSALLFTTELCNELTSCRKSDFPRIYISLILSHFSLLRQPKFIPISVQAFQSQEACANTNQTFEYPCTIYQSTEEWKGGAGWEKKYNKERRVKRSQPQERDSVHEIHRINILTATYFACLRMLHAPKFDQVKKRIYLNLISISFKAFTFEESPCDLKLGVFAGNFRISKCSPSLL